MQTLNNFQTNKFKLIFSNLPTISSTMDANHFTTNYVKSVIIPEYSNEVVYSEYKNFITANPISKINDEFSPITIEYKLSENFENYFYFYSYINKIRHGESSREFIKNYTINNIDVISLDNQNREKMILRFSECFPSSLSSVSLEFGNGDETSFNMTFIYKNMDLINI